MNWKKVAYAVAPVLLAGGLYLSGSDVLAKTVTTVIKTVTKGTVVEKDTNNIDSYRNGGYTFEARTDESGYAHYCVYGITETETATITEVPDDPVITEKTVPVAEPVVEVPACEHSFSWVEEQEATATEDAIYVNRCGNCGIVIGSRREPGTAAGKFQQEIQEKYITAEEILDVLCRVLPASQTTATASPLAAMPV